MASTGNSPEDPDRVRIAKGNSPGARKEVVLSLGPRSKTDLGLPALQPGDRLRLFAELEVTTDYQDPNADGLIGNAYSYDPLLEAELLVAADADAAAAKPGRAIRIGKPWPGTCTHRRHHRLITFAEYGYTVPTGGLGWSGAYYINVALGAASPKARSGDVVLVGQNDPDKPVVGRDMAGIRVVRLRPAQQPAGVTRTTRKPLVAGVPVAKREVVVYSRALDPPFRRDEQLVVKGGLITDASTLGYPARITTRLFIADDPNQTSPGGIAATALSWKGHLSKPNGTNRLPEDGAQPSHKFGVARVLRAVAKPLYVNLVAVSADPTHAGGPGDKLPIVPGGFIEVARYPADRYG
jgi:hypothetical protein